MIYNGEIYNYKEIDPETNSDTKLLFDMMSQKGQHAFAELRGMFAMGWFNKKNKEVTFYRDFYGEKPLYYYLDKNLQIVSSTLKSIKYIVESFGGILKLNKTALLTDYKYFGYIREPETIWENVFAVPPGHFMSVSDNQPEFEPLDFGLKKKKGQIPITGNYLSQALSSRDVEGALLLSGGIDSPYILASAFENKIPLIIGIYKANNKQIDESDKAIEHKNKIIGANSEYLVSVLTDGENEGSNHQKYAQILEQPTSDGLQVYSLIKHLKANNPSLKLVYTGLGGDEIFGGYPTFRNYTLINLMIRLPFIERLIPKVKRFKEGRRIIGKWNYSVYSFMYRFRYNVYKESDDSPSVIKDTYERYEKTLLSSPLINRLYKDVNEHSFIKFSENYDYMRNQLLRDNDNISMFLGIESRSPLLNPDWINIKPDNKKRLKKYLVNKYQLKFGKKKGFTLDETNSRNEYLNDIINNKAFYSNVFNVGDTNYISTSDLRSMYIFKLWYNFNMNHG
jgi:asparagine synthase (glutamine-hydrolysing)